MSNPLKVFIVEDEVLSAMALRMDLVRNGYDVCGFVPTGEEAVKQVALNKPDIVLMDINLAGEMNGIQAAEQILAANHPTRLVFISGYCIDEIQQRTKELSKNKLIQTRILWG